ncbi:hypothetical protein A2U01_0118298, partial [Trifolium medium]|nr:hypothetical protein [Trifolium medium]
MAPREQNPYLDSAGHAWG